jgi:hypothetical protein
LVPATIKQSKANARCWRQQHPAQKPTAYQSERAGATKIPSKEFFLDEVERSFYPLGMTNSTESPSPGSARERLLDAAEALIYAGGIHATGVDAIVRQSGTARKSFYTHFESKDALDEMVY